MNSAISTKNLRKDFKEVTALSGVDLEVPEGQIFGLIGPNGSGKTTLIKILTGLLRSTSGQVSVLGMDPINERNRLHEQIGYMPQTDSLYDDLSARDNVRFFAKACGVANADERAAEMLRFVELEHRANHKIHTFSGGMRKRVSLACTLVHKPRLLFLDEPTAAVDPELKLKFWALFRELSGQGCTLFISTHLMDEALYCDQVAILRKGELVFVSTPDKFLQEGRSKVKVVDGSGKSEEKVIPAEPGDLAQLLQGFGLKKEITSIEIKNESFEEIVLKIAKKRAKK